MASCRILVVEDELIVAEDIRHMLEDLGHRVTAIARSASEALRHAEADRPDLALLDIKLAPGDSDGIAAAAALKERFDVPVVFVTAFADEDTVRRAGEAAPFSYLVKPFEERELRAAVETTLHRHRLESELRQANATLEERVAARTAELTSANEKLKAEIELRQRTERQLLVATAQRDHVVSSGPAVLYACRTSGDYGTTYISANVERQLGYTPRQFTDDSGFWLDRVHTDDKERILAGLPSLFERGEIVHEYRFQHADGAYRWMRDELRVVKNERDEPIELVGYWIDISDRKAAELALGRLNAELEDRVARRTAELQMTGERLAAELRERIAAENALRVQAARNQRLLETTLDGYILADLQGRLVDVNPSYCAIVGYSRAELLGMNIHELEAGVGSDEVEQRIREIEQDGRARFETRHQAKDARLVDLDVSSSVLGGEEVPLVAAFVRDITERKRADEALAESERKFRQLAEQSPNMIFINQAGSVVYANRMWEEIGYTREEFYAPGYDFRALIAPESQDLVAANLARHAKGDEIPPQEYILVAKDGRRLQVLIATSLIDYQGGRAILGIVTDITAHKRGEAELWRSREDLRRLAGRVESVREEERTRLARELHDELGQTLTALRMDLSHCTEDKSLSRPLAERASTMIALVDSGVETVRRIAADLRPGVLDDLGLKAAVEWQTSEFAGRAGISCTTDLEELNLDRDRSTAVFRILQESLTNVARHAEAVHVHVALASVAGRVHLSVRDDGRGMDVASKSSSSGLGLLGMRERVAAFGGEIGIRSALGEGTTVSVTLPLEKVDEGGGDS